MATKEEVVQYIKTLGEQNVLTKDELISAFDAGQHGGDSAAVRKLGIAEILYYIGGAIVFLGISILLFQNWDTLGFPAKVLSTLGSGIAAYIVGLLFVRNEKTETMGLAFYLISALVLPIGLMVVFDHAGFDTSSFGMQSFTSAILLAVYLSSYFLFKKSIFTLFSILFGTWLFFSFTSLMVGSGPYFDGWHFYEYRVLVAGIAYILLGYSFAETKQAALSGFLYGFGILGFLGTALALGGWEPNQNVFWEVIYPGLVFGVLFISVYIKSKSFLTWGTIFLMAYILKITSEYFSTGLGWPLALILAGLGMIGVGYASVTIKKKYLA